MGRGTEVPTEENNVTQDFMCFYTRSRKERSPSVLHLGLSLCLFARVRNSKTIATIDPLHDDVSHQNKPRRVLNCGSFQGSLIVKTMAKAVVLFREVDIKGTVLPEKVVDKNTRKALRRWISRRGLTTTVAESFDLYEGY